MTATTPWGCRMVRIRLVGSDDGRTAVSRRLTSPPASRNNSAAKATSDTDSAYGLPCSRESSFAISSLLESSTVATRSHNAARSKTGISAIAPRASTAASMAACASLLVPCGSRARTSPVAGLTLSNVCSSLDPPHPPPIYIETIGASTVSIIDSLQTAVATLTDPRPPHATLGQPSSCSEARFPGGRNGFFQPVGIRSTLPGRLHRGRTHPDKRSGVASQPPPTVRRRADRRCLQSSAGRHRRRQDTARLHGVVLLDRNDPRQHQALRAGNSQCGRERAGLFVLR